MAYEILPGVKQDAKGRLYQVGRYPNGKLIDVPYQDTKAPPARMIPVPVQAPRVILRVMRKVDNTKRLAHVRWRDKDKPTVFHDFTNDPEVIQRFVEEQCVPFCRFDGKNWLIVSYQVDWFVQYHTIIKEKANDQVA